MTQYSRSGARRGSGSWQWMILGFIPGILCGVITVAGVLASGIVNLESLQPPQPTPTQVVIVVSPTLDPNQPTEAPIVITATPEPTDVAPPTSENVVVATQETPEVPDDSSGDVADVAEAPSVVPSSEESSSVQVFADEPDTDTDTSGVAQPPVQPTEAVAEAPSAPSVSIPPELVSIPSQLVAIPGGEYSMGTTTNEIIEAVNQCRNRDGGNCELAYGEDSYPQIGIALETYQMELTEVTFAQYSAFLNYLQAQGLTHLNGCNGFACIQTRNESENAVITFDGQNYAFPPLSANFPVYGVTWYGASAYCEAIGRRLPSESEWEYAARGNDGRIYPWGNSWASDLAQTNRSGGDPGPVEVASKGGSSASPFGLFDMAGNVGEWVVDYYNPNYYSQLSSQPQPITNPVNEISQTLERVIRGGHWDAVPFFARTMHRQSATPDTTQRWIGFRCAADGDVGAASIQPNTSDNQTQPTGNASAAGDVINPDSLLDEAPSAPQGSNQPTLAPAVVPPTETETIEPATIGG